MANVRKSATGRYVSVRTLSRSRPRKMRYEGHPTGCGHPARSSDWRDGLLQCAAKCREQKRWICSDSTGPGTRSEERGGGQAVVGTGRYRGSPDKETKKA